MNKKSFIAIGAAAVVIILLVIISNAVVYVPEDNSVCIKRFDKVIDTHKEPGLVFKTPFVDTAVFVPTNAQIYNLTPSDVLTLDKKAMTVSSYVVWKIVNPLQFMQTVVTRAEAERRLDVVVYNSVKNLLSSLNQSDAISSRGKELDDRILGNAKGQTIDYGIEIIDVQIKQFDLPQDNKEAVYNRMVSERQQIAAKFSAEGKEEAEIIKNSADKDAALLISKAKASAEQLKAEGESEYMRILSSAYSGDERAEFYEFIRSMDALKITMRGDKVLFLPLDSQLGSWLYGIK